MSFQSSNHVLLIKPAEFYCNEQTIETNHYQLNDGTLSHEVTLSLALEEFNRFEKNLIDNGIRVTSREGNLGCPDNIYPNWAVTFSDKSMHIFSMLG